MKKLIFLSALLLGTVSAQAQSWQWARQSNYYYANVVFEVSPLITTDISGNVYAFGTNCSISFGTDAITGDCIYYAGHGLDAESMFLVKYDSLGNEKWLKEIFQGMPHDSSSNYTNAVVTDASGNIYLTGSVRDTIFTCGSITIHKSTPIGYFLVKIDSNGNEQWVRTAGGRGATGGASLSVGRDGNIYVIGYGADSASFGSYLLSNSMPYCNFFAIYDPDGNVVKAVSINGNNPLYLYNIFTDNLNNIFISGYISDSIYLDTTAIGYTNTAGYFTVKFDSAVTPSWVCDNIYVITTDRANNIYAQACNDSSITFDTSIHTNAGYGYFVKYTPTGGVIWAKPSTNFAGAFDFKVDDSFNIYTAENYANDSFYVVKYDSLGNQSWNKTVSFNLAYGSNGATATSLATSINNSVYLAGYFSCFQLTFGTTTLTVDSITYWYFHPWDEGQSIFLAKLNTTYNDEVATITPSVNEIIIYPNPTTGLFTIKTTAFKTNSLVIIQDLLGRIIETRKIDGSANSKQVFDLSAYRAGIYFVNVNADGVVYNSKIILK